MQTTPVIQSSSSGNTSRWMIFLSSNVQFLSPTTAINGYFVSQKDLQRHLKSPLGSSHLLCVQTCHHQLITWLQIELLQLLCSTLLFPQILPTTPCNHHMSHSINRDAWVMTPSWSFIICRFPCWVSLGKKNSFPIPWLLILSNTIWPSQTWHHCVALKFLQREHLLWIRSTKTQAWTWSNLVKLETEPKLMLTTQKRATTCCR